MKIRNILIRSISALVFSGAITGGMVLAHTNSNVDKLGLLTRAVQDQKVEQLRTTRGDITVELGIDHSAAVIDGALYTWGSNSVGQLGLRDTNDRNLPTQVTKTSNGTIGRVSRISLGVLHSTAVINDELYTWGENRFGQLGLGDFINRNIPTQVKGTFDGPTIAPRSITQIESGASFSMAIINDSLYTWGQNNNGQLGLGDDIPVGKPINIPTQVRVTADGIFIAPGTVTGIALGYFHSVAIINGNLYTWGWDREGLLGLGPNPPGSVNESINIPTKVENTSNGSLTGTISKIAAGNFHSAAIIGGELYTWGGNKYGELGLGSTNTNDNIYTPTKVTNTFNNTPIVPGTITEISLGGNNSAAIIADTFYIWGYNSSGQLGLGSNAPKLVNIPTPVTVTSEGTPITPGTVTQIALGGSEAATDGYSAAVINNKLYTWGSNLNGKLGLGITSAIVNEPTNVAALEFTYEPTGTIPLGPENDKNNYRDKIVYNVKATEIEAILNQKPSIIPNAPLEKFEVVILKSLIGKTTTGFGQIVAISVAGAKKYETTFDNFKPVNLTSEIEIPHKSLPSDGIAHFAGNDVNKLVTDANADITGANNKLAEWIIENSSSIIGSTANEYTADFPIDTKITKISDVQEASGTGSISFKIHVNKYYKRESGTNNNLVESSTSDPIIKLNNPITLSGFRTMSPSIPTVIANSNRNISATQLLKEFGYVDLSTPITGSGLVKLKEYIDLTSFPSDTNFHIDRLSSNSLEISFFLSVNKYYDGNGKLIINSSPISKWNRLVIDGLENAESILVQSETYDKINPDVILAYIGYDRNDPTKPLIIDNLLDYVTIQKAFPIDVEFTLASPPIISPNRTELTLKIQASNSFNINGSTISTPKTFGPFTYNGLSDNFSTNIKAKTNYDNNILSGDLITKFVWDNATGRFDRDFVNQYVNFSSGVKNAEYTMENLAQIDSGKSISFDIIANMVYVNGQVQNSPPVRPFTITITGLKTIANTSINNFLRTDIIGNDEFNGNSIANQMIAYITPGKIITYNDLFWNKLFDVTIYPPETTFTIQNITINDKVIYKTFRIFFEASNYYENNTTMKAKKQYDVTVDNLKFVPTSFTIKDKLPSIDPYQFFKYINYNDATKSFNPKSLQEFINFKGFNLNVPGVSTRMTSPKIDNFEIKFTLEVSSYVNAAGKGIVGAMSYDVIINPSLISSNTPSVSSDQYPIDSIIGTSIGGGAGFWLLLLLTSIFIQRKRTNKTNDQKDDSVTN